MRDFLSEARAFKCMHGRVKDIAWNPRCNLEKSSFGASVPPFSVWAPRISRSIRRRAGLPGVSPVFILNKTPV
ncbi:hypothetical protein OJAV_G00019530 [Oryzias javanicus]|uniref:Uncharacterized protein n=1 Tax=Oryzias javanicus TaxID=123683 RepID=A0A3S2MTT7_ORYJA|nr:hypothetical protein OJAV_G00019530 [Oryzias javanicus]